MTAFSPESGPPSATLIQDLWSTLGRLESALGAISDALCITDSERLVLWCNQQFEELVSAPRLALLGKPIEDLIQRLPFEDRRVDLRSTLQQHPDAGAIDMLMSKEPISALRIEWSHVAGENPPSTIFTFRDISDQVTLEELRTQQIELISEETRFAITSALCPITGLKMRPSMLRDIEATLSEGQGQLYALLLFNIRAFRLINDRHGYATGDELLAEIARRLKQAIRSGDDLARMGGDQFAVFAKLSDIEELSAITSRLKGAVESTPFLPATTQAVVHCAADCQLIAYVVLMILCVRMLSGRCAALHPVEGHFSRPQQTLGSGLPPPDHCASRIELRVQFHYCLGRRWQKGCRLYRALEPVRDG